MKRNHLCYSLFMYVGILLMTGCQDRPKQSYATNTITDTTEMAKPDTLSFTTLKDSVVERDSVYEFSIELAFPKSGPEAIRKALGKYIVDRLTSLIPNIDTNKDTEVKAHTYQGNQKDGKTLITYYRKEYISGFQSWIKEVGKSDITLFLTIYGSNQWESDQAITYGIEEESFMGGAHGARFSLAQTFRKSDGKAIQIIDTTKIDEMQKMMYEGLRRDYFNEIGEPNSDKDIANMLFDKHLPLPSRHLAMAQDGIYFFYQQYEIAPYVYGTPNFIIPYNQIKPYMTPEARELIPEQKTVKKEKL